jgi:hypothetical protein
VDDGWIAPVAVIPSVVRRPPFVVSDWNRVFVNSMRSIRKWLRACAQQAFVASCILFPFSHAGQAPRWLALRSHRLSQPTD